MTAFYVNDVPYLPTSRAKKLGLAPLVVCSLCGGILWSPVACQNCDTPYCAVCIENWHSKEGNSSRCPYQKCSSYVQRPCPPANQLMLEALQITCRFNENKCPETLMYNDLKEHETNCGYRLMICSGCEKKIIKNEFHEHERTCPLVVLKCGECDSSYKRRDEGEHTEIHCLRVQLRQIRERVEQVKQENDDKINELKTQVQHLRK